MGADPTIWPYLRKIWPDIVGNKYMEFLPCFQDDHMMHLIFQFLTDRNSKESRQNATKEDINMYINTFHSIIAKHSKNEVTLEKILWNFNDIKPP